MPAQGTMKLSSEAYKLLAHRAIDAEMRPNELLDAIVLHSDWEKDLPALVTAANRHRGAPERILAAKTEESAHKLPENTELPRSTSKTPKASQEGAERTKTQESLGKFTVKEETVDAEPSR